MIRSELEGYTISACSDLLCSKGSKYQYSIYLVGIWAAAVYAIDPLGVFNLGESQLGVNFGFKLNRSADPGTLNPNNSMLLRSTTELETLKPHRGLTD